ncbi:hypothetical protein BH09BAC2_BH09BAC2_06650 [soil metagenome]
MNTYVKSTSVTYNFVPFDEATKQKVNKHLTDIDDVITEEDMKNINTDPRPYSDVRPNSK